MFDSLDPHVQRAIGTLLQLSSVLRPKSVIEAMYQGVSGRYLIRSFVAVNPLDHMAVVTMLISWRRNCMQLGYQSVSADLTVDQLCVSSSKALQFSLDELNTGCAMAELSYCTFF